MRIINTTGIARDTCVLNDDGRDITRGISAIVITIEAGAVSRVQIEVVCPTLDVVGDLVTPVAEPPASE